MPRATSAGSSIRILPWPSHRRHRHASAFLLEMACRCPSRSNADVWPACRQRSVLARFAHGLPSSPSGSLPRLLLPLYLPRFDPVSPHLPAPSPRPPPSPRFALCPFISILEIPYAPSVIYLTYLCNPSCLLSNPPSPSLPLLGSVPGSVLQRLLSHSMSSLSHSTFPFGMCPRGVRRALRSILTLFNTLLPVRRRVFPWRRDGVPCHSHSLRRRPVHTYHIETRYAKSECSK
ncbi:hypothetical protein C8Q73DRAFT_156960 [Cubamyces lactineus]|nr:hypothetical protein C8Q73DRAFT_156960 [Cubamyces lactineus]